MQLVFATHNKHKVSEIKPLLPAPYTLVTLDEIGCNEEIPETGDTLSSNALQKAMYVYDEYKCDCFADDTGLEVNELQGKPGVYSARYAGEAKSAADNIEKLLGEMQEYSDRAATFKTVIALILKGKPYLFEGYVKGSIATLGIGTNGFGYDPIFIPEGQKLSFAQMTLQQKNEMSHRARAVQKFVQFLKGLN
jgi:XTP/dITP diphosphohydrolase